MTQTLLNNNWIAGFIDGDGSFALDKVGDFYRPSLSIAQNDPQLLYKIKQYFGCGSVTAKNAKAWHYKCRSAEQFEKFIIPKLGRAPFQTIKQFQYEVICDEVMPILLIKRPPLSNANVPPHRHMGENDMQDPNNKEGNYSKNLEPNNPNNKGDLLAILEKCQKKITESRILLGDYSNPQTAINLDWFLGFFEAEGNFYLRVREPKDIRIAFKVTNANYALLEKIQSFLNFGRVQYNKEGYKRNTWKYNVEGVENVCTYGLPLFANQPLKGLKNIKREHFLKAVRIIAKNGHKTEEGLVKLRKLADSLKN